VSEVIIWFRYFSGRVIRIIFVVIYTIFRLVSGILCVISRRCVDVVCPCWFCCFCFNDFFLGKFRVRMGENILVLCVL